jgi:pimeloyl-ACP methyl ester carboxylesterase
VPTAGVNGRELYYDLTGGGTAVVLIHSAIADSTLWDAQVAALRERFRVLRYDVAGFGHSRLEPGPISHVRDLEALLAHAGIEHAALVGNSMGARIALEYALVHPEVVQALVLLAGGLPDHDWSEEMQRADEREERLFEAGDFEAAAESQVRFWVDGPGRGPDAVDPAVRERSRAAILRSYELYTEASTDGEPGPAEWLDPPASDRLGEIAVPTLVVVGDRDASDLLAIADRLEAEIPGARKAVVPDAAHLLPLEKPAELNRLLLEFLPGA